MGPRSPLLSDISERRCGRCLLTQPLDMFCMKKRAAKYPGRLSAMNSTCKACMAEDRKASKATGAFEASRLRLAYGMTIEDWNLMFMRQSGCCVICRRHQTEVPKAKLQVDHCHASGVVRGLLCSDCNMGLGLFRDNAESLARAIHYLQPRAGGADEGLEPKRRVEKFTEKAG